jgi:pyruvate-formate lyase-activating enzyme
MFVDERIMRSRCLNRTGHGDRQAHISGVNAISRHINLSVARSCFVRCPACYNHFGRPNRLVSSTTIVSFLRFARYRGFDRVTLCGGDPLSRPDILELLGDIRALGLRINLDTVGTPLLGDSRATFFGDGPVPSVDVTRLVELVDLVGIPLDGSSNDVIAQFRTGRSDLLSEQISILGLLDEAGAAICVNTVVHRGNLTDLGPIASRIELFSGVTKWQLFQFSPSGPLGFHNRSTFEISEASFTQAQHEILSHRSTSLPPVVEFKSNSARDGAYLLVDSEGQVWTPDAGAHPSSQAAPGRHLLGTIEQRQHWHSILEFARRGATPDHNQPLHSPTRDLGSSPELGGSPQEHATGGVATCTPRR